MCKNQQNFWHSFQFLLIFLMAINFGFCTFSPNFSAFLAQRFGKDVEVDLARRDLGPAGSFGGGQHLAGQRTQRRPILMVHGLSTIAGEYENLRQYFLLNGYSDAEVYATTYAHGKLNWTKDSMECRHIKRVNKGREFIYHFRHRFFSNLSFNF
jgi:triacylglycerol lipase